MNNEIFEVGDIVHQRIWNEYLFIIGIDADGGEDRFIMLNLSDINGPNSRVYRNKEYMIGHGRVNWKKVA